MTIYEEIAAERAAQDQKWGGPGHDDTHGPADWATWIAGKMRKGLENPPDLRRRLVQVAAIAVAAIEAHDRRGPRWPRRGRAEEAREGLLLFPGSATATTLSAQAPAPDVPRG